MICRPAARGCKCEDRFDRWWGAARESRRDRPMVIEPRRGGASVSGRKMGLLRVGHSPELLSRPLIRG